MKPRVRYTSKGLYWVEHWGGDFGTILVGPFKDLADVAQWRVKMRTVEELAKARVDAEMATFLARRQSLVSWNTIA